MNILNKPHFVVYEDTDDDDDYFDTDSVKVFLKSFLLSDPSIAQVYAQACAQSNSDKTYEVLSLVDCVYVGYMSYLEQKTKPTYMFYSPFFHEKKLLAHESDVAQIVFEEIQTQKTDGVLTQEEIETSWTWADHHMDTFVAWRVQKEHEMIQNHEVVAQALSDRHNVIKKKM